MILRLRRLASGAWKARRSKSTAAPQLLAVVLVLICLIQQTVAASRSDGLTQPRTESSGRSVTGVRKVLKHRVGWVREQVQNASQCTGGSHCHAGQVCEMSKTTSRWMCFDYCSPDRQQAVQCPKNSVCRYLQTPSVGVYCQCSEPFQEDNALRDFNCNIKTCDRDEQCADSEVCVSRGSSPGRKCVPTCTGRTCPKGATCSAVGKHGHNCTCKTGFHSSRTGCYMPVSPDPLVPIITWSTGLVSRGFKACRRNNNSLECEQEFFAVEGVTRELRCEVRDVFPSPTGVKFILENPEGEVVETITPTQVRDVSEETRRLHQELAATKSDSSTLGHGGGHFRTRTFVYSLSYKKPSLTHANHTFKCVADVYAEDGTSSRVIETRTKPFNVYPCPEMTRDGRCEFSILRLASNPEIFVKNGSELNLGCKSSLPLLGDPEVAECSWVLRREGREYAKVSFRGSQEVLGSEAHRGLRELVQAERMLTKDSRDCNVKISQTERWMEGNWSCSTVSFDGRRVTSNSPNNSGLGELQIRVHDGVVSTDQGMADPARSRESKEPMGLSGTKIVEISAGAIVAVLVVGWVLAISCFLLRRRRRNRQEEQEYREDAHESNNTGQRDSGRVDIPLPALPADPESDGNEREMIQRNGSPSGASVNWRQLESVPLENLDLFYVDRGATAGTSGKGETGNDDEEDHIYESIA